MAWTCLAGVDRPSRQQKLRATIAWGYGLPNWELQTVYRRLGVFAGHGDLDAVEMDHRRWQARKIHGVWQAVGHRSARLSLIMVTEAAALDVRVGMLEPVREHAIDRWPRPKQLQ